MYVYLCGEGTGTGIQFCQGGVMATRLDISQGHSERANAVGFGTFCGFSKLLVCCANLSSVWGGMCILFEICEKMLFQKCMGWGGGGGRWSHF